MTLHRTTLFTTCLTLTLLGTACDLGDKSIGNDTGADQGETGDPTGDGDETTEQSGFGGNCGEEVVSVVEGLNAAVPGFDDVAADYLPLFEGTFMGEFAWIPEEEGPVIIEHAGTASPLTVTVTYEGGEIRVIETELVGQPPQGDGELEDELCSNVLLIDVTLGFATEDGLFAETFEVPIRVLSHPDWLSPSFSFSLDMDAWQGELALDDFVVEEGMVSDLVLGGQFDGELVSGGLNIEILTMDWVGFGNIGGYDAAR
jgi:hypothetical protein